MITKEMQRKAKVFTDKFLAWMLDTVSVINSCMWIRLMVNVARLDQVNKEILLENF